MSVRNITRAFRLASDADIQDGIGWYANAMALARSLDPANPERAAGVIAALSPMNSWPRNVILAREVYEGKIPATLYKNRDKALAIYAGADPLTVLSGNKVRSFYMNIVGIDDIGAVTIDRHAIDVSAGKVQNDKDRSKSVSGKGAYANVVQEYVRAAKIVSREAGTHITAAQLQAIVWVYWRRSVIANFHGDV